MLHAEISSLIGFGNLTLSIAPDETQVGRQQSNLEAVFDEKFGSSTWRLAIEEAVQTWVPHANVNVGFVTDDGSPAGTSGRWRGDPRFGDVRIFGLELEGTAWAEAIDANSRATGTWSGDIVFNTAQNWTSIDQVRTAAAHELGHVLGLQHSEDPLSLMHEHGQSGGSDLLEDDIREIRERFGHRQGDFIDPTKNNDDIKEASRLRGGNSVSENEGFDGSQAWLAMGDISTSDDVDYYRFDVAQGYTGPIAVSAQVAGLSVADLTVSVMNREEEIRGVVEVDPKSGFAFVVIDVDDADEKIFIRVNSSQPNVSGIGSYGLHVSHPSVVHEYQDALVQWATKISQWHRNDKHADRGYSFPGLDPERPTFKAENADEEMELEPMLETSARSVYSATGILSEPHQVDNYRFELPATMVEGDSVLLEVHSVEQFGLVPKITVSSSSDLPVSTQTTFKGDGVTQLFIHGVSAGDRLMISIGSDNVADRHRTGSYRIVVESSDAFSSPIPLIDGLIDNEQRSAAMPIALTESQILSFTFSSQSISPANQSVDSALVFRLYNDKQELLHSYASPVDDLRSVSGLLLSPGVYYTQLTLATDSDEPQSYSSQLTADSLTDPIGPLEVSDEMEPLFDCLQVGDLCFPLNSPTVDPLIINPLPTPPLPDPFLNLPSNLGDEWFWDSFVIPVSRQLAPTPVNNQQASTGSETVDLTTSTTLTASATVSATLTQTTSGSTSVLSDADTDSSGTSGSQTILLASAGSISIQTPIVDSSVSINVSAQVSATDQTSSSITTEAVVGLLMDVNGDGAESASDALMIINSLAENNVSGELTPESLSLDVNQDGRLTASDALWVINHLRLIG